MDIDFDKYGLTEEKYEPDFAKYGLTPENEPDKVSQKNVAPKKQNLGILERLSQNKKMNDERTSQQNSLGYVGDLLSGVATAGQNIGNVGNSLLGREKANVDFSNLFGNHPNKAVQEIGKYLPFAIGGGTGLVGSTLASGAYGATQTENPLIGAPVSALANALTHGLFKGVGLYNKSKPENIVKNIIGKGEEIRNKYKGLYGDLFNESKERNVNDLSNIVPELDKKRLLKSGLGDETENIENFLKNPTVENAHRANSDLKSISRRMKSNPERNSVIRNRYQAVQDAREKIDKEIFKDHPDLKQRYNEITKGYANEDIPYSKNKDILKYKGKELSEEQLANKLLKGKFNVQRGEQHPELRNRELINNLIKKAAITGGLLTGGKTVFDLLKNSLTKRE